MGKKRQIEFLRMLYLKGPNIWTYRPTLEAWVDIGELEDYPSNTLPGFYERLTAWLPTLEGHRCGIDETGGFLIRLREGTWAGHILEHVTIELQNLAGVPTSFGKARETTQRGVYKVVVRARSEELSRAAMHAARELVMAAINDEPYDMSVTVEDLRDLAERHCLGPSTACIVDAADDRDIPSIRLNDGNLVQLGYGAAQRRIWTAETDRTSAIAESISRDKDLTKSLLASCGVPVPEGRLVESADDAWEAAQDIGLPVVVKPDDGNHGRGVFTNLMTREEIAAAYAVAVEEGSGVIVEQFIRGIEHRVLVVGGKVAAVACGEVAAVKGDGRSTILELIESQLNSDPRRGSGEDYPLNVVRLDSAARLEIARQGYTGDSVPPAGHEVMIQRNGNVGIDVTKTIHPEVAHAATLAARMVGLDIAGIDLVCEDASRPLADQGGAIVEVNAGPGLLMHLKPSAGEPQPVGRAIVEHLFPQGQDGYIPIVGVGGTSHTTQVSGMIARFLGLQGMHCGLVCGTGLYLDGRQVEKGDRANWAAAHKLMLNPSIEVAVVENRPESILRDGLAFDRCDVAVVLSLDTAMQLPEYYIETPEKMYAVLRTLVDVVRKNGAAVLNADDPHVAAMAELCDGEVIWFGANEDSSVIAEHRKQGGRAALLRGNKLTLLAGEHELVQMSVPGQAMMQDMPVQSIAAAAAAVWALNVPVDVIRAGIETLMES